MAKQIQGKLNQLEHLLPQGLLADAAWFGKQGYSTSLRRQYVTGGWLEQPARQVYQRPQGSPPGWQQVVISLQTLLGHDLVVGGRTALELQGFTHYLAQELRKVHLYGPKPPPTWLGKLSPGVTFEYHNSEKLFKKTGHGDAGSTANTVVAQPWGQWDWTLNLSSPERALLELLDELPDNESFHQIDKLVEGLTHLSPRKLEALLVHCHNVKVKRLFFFFADRHKHAWLDRINKKAIDLGKGKRMLVKGGKLNLAYQITVPEDLDAA